MERNAGVCDMTFFALVNRKTGFIDLISSESMNCVPDGFLNHELIKVKRGTAGWLFEV